MHIRADRLTKRFGWVTALDNLSWEVEPGQIVAVLGANGAGKTTLMNALSGSILLDNGQVILDGEPFTPGRVDLRRRLACIPDIPPVARFWTPLRFIGAALKLYGKTDSRMEERVVELLGQLDLIEVARWRFHQLSRGQAYKAVLAAFLAADPEVWLIDEPFASGMDPRGLDCFKQYAREAAGRGHTIIFTTQIIEAADRFADRICVIEKGRIQAWGTVAELQGTPAFSSLLSAARNHPASEPALERI